MANNIKYDIGLRIKELREKNFRSAADAARAHGVTPATWSSIEHGKNMPKADSLTALAKLLRTSVAHLIGEDEERDRSVGTIPVYDTGGGSSWMVADDAEPYQLERPQSLTGYRINGDSMEPLARDGQIVLTADVNDVVSGDLAIVEREDGTHSFKRVHFQDGVVILQSVNPSYAPEMIKRRDVRRISRVWGVKF